MTQIGNWQRKSRDIVYRNNWITVFHDEVINPSGGDGIYGVVRFENLAIGIIPIDDEGCTWLVGQHRYPQDKYSWEIPEGGGRIGVDPLDSAKRELQEEVGLGAHRWERVLDMDLSNSVTDEAAIVFLARDIYPLEATPEETEDLSLVRVPFGVAVERVMRGEITDAISVAGLLKVHVMLSSGRI
jgi:8-oxo-dGTP pyrophosphatase MutT (NUDIX family)